MAQPRLLLLAVLFLLTSRPTSATCPTNFVDVAGNCFLFLNRIVQNYVDAKTICEDFGGDLAILDECHVFGSVVDYIYNNGLEVNSGYWIGATDVLSEGQWQWIDSTAVEMGAPFWSGAGGTVSEPTFDEYKNCASMSPDNHYYFRDLDCNLVSGRSPMCQRPPVNGTCPAPYAAIGGTCFQFLDTLSLTWSEARDVCQSSLGDLAIIRDCSLVLLLTNYIETNMSSPDTGYWIGGTDTGHEGNWTWIDESLMPMGVPFWGRDVSGLQPDNNGGIENCLVMTSKYDYFLNDGDCNHHAAALCQAAPLPTTAPPPATAVVH